jgi:hypothetical protein
MSTDIKDNWEVVEVSHIKVSKKCVEVRMC